jgi:hypothetical protein
LSRHEDFVTYFDDRFLLQGLALYESLRSHCADVRLWVICLDDAVARKLDLLGLPGLVPVPLQQFETPRLLQAKADRPWREYIFAMTPFTFEYVFRAVPETSRVTYVDADVFFFRDPKPWLDDRMDGRSVVLTEHGYAPEYQQLDTSAGVFSVQFLPIQRSACGASILQRWQDQCIESTSLAMETRDRVCGDQKYLEDWPSIFPDCVEVVGREADIQGPWNAAYLQRSGGGGYWPLLFHFHSLARLSDSWVQLCAGYDVRPAMHLYRAYLVSLGRQQSRCVDAGIEVSNPGTPGLRAIARLVWRTLRGRLTLARLESRSGQEASDGH